jgi:ATP-dependent HslUV protease, peptidase subunit HslV
MSAHMLLPKQMSLLRAVAFPPTRYSRPSSIQHCVGSVDRSRLFSSSPLDRHGTTIVCVRKNGQVCMMGDGMVSQGSMIVKPNALKLRRIVTKSGKMVTDGKEAENVTLVGFAGSTADAFTLLERLEGKLDEYPGQLARSCVELAKGWRTDKYLRRLEASLIVADSTCSLELTGNGDVLESHDGVLGVGSGSPYAIGMLRIFMGCFWLLLGQKYLTRSLVSVFILHQPRHEP